MVFFSRTEASRKYIDLLKETSSKWANWDPPKRIRAGDFGTIDRKTGKLDCEGNIYDNPETSNISAQYPVEEPAGEESLMIRSYRTKDNKNDVGLDFSLMNVGTALLSVEIHFSKERGAFLIMHKVRMSVVPDPLLVALKGNPTIKGKVVVTQIFSCNGYAQYMSSGGEYKVSVSLSGNADALACAAPISGGAHAGTAWHAKGIQGLFRHAYNDNPVYVPLFCLKSFRKRLFDRRDLPDSEDEELLDVDVPWNDLNEDGVERDDDDVQEEDVSDIPEFDNF